MEIIEYDQEGRTRLASMVEAQQAKPGCAMDSWFYQSPSVYQTELSSVMFKSWLCAGHISQIPEAGDYFLFELDKESIIVCRDSNGQIHALFNNCRHRGSRVCEQASGKRKTFVCPYHGWVYELDGTLKSARQMDVVENFIQEDHGLGRAQVNVCHGFIMINCDPEAPAIAKEVESISIPLSAHEPEQWKIAHQQTYTVDANWKLALENYLECYHCATAHRAYAKLHTISDLEDNIKQETEEMMARCEQLTGVSGIGTEVYKVYQHAESAGGGVECSRYALYPGHVSGSENGQAVAPLLGKLRGYDGGLADFQFGPLTFLIVYPDHGVMYRFVPRSITRTDMLISWFVRNDAEEGRDYEKEKLTWLWHRTTLEDEYIIRRNAEGVNSQFYQPGPYHTEYEYACLDFVQWYLARLTEAR
ncbi:MAG: aromatic ring-hydroxylating dioxygenase subunit alpha [Pseudomonadales bacterium]